jgi:hypothetical protein
MHCRCLKINLIEIKAEARAETIEINVFKVTREEGKSG